jgi:colanic acid/amylovoran biosynthesis glycosyltransferase
MADRKQLRLLVVGLAWPAETFIARLLEGLTDAGVDVTVAHSQRPGGDWVHNERVHWLRTPAWEGFVAKRLIVFAWLWSCAALRSTKDLKVFARQMRPMRSLSDRFDYWNRLLPFNGRRWDLIYFPWNSAAIDYAPLTELGCGTVISCRGSQINIAPYNSKRAVLREGLRRSFGKAVAIHCVSFAIKSEALQYGLEESKVSVIYPAVSPHHFRPNSSHSTLPPPLRIITTGALHWVKGHEYALLAIRSLVEGGLRIRYDIVGDGPERQRLSYTIRDLNLEAHVHLHGKLTPDEVKRQLQAAHVFLLSSLSEGVSNAVLEAMACGLPIVTTDCGGMREAVTDDQEGFVVPTRDPEAMAAALAKLCADPALQVRMGQAGRARILQQFDLARQIKQFVGLFTGVANAG